MQEKIKAFLDLYEVFHKHGYQLYLVGGTVRDIYLKIPLTDMDVVTDATPEEMKSFLDADYTFSKMGSVKYNFSSVKFDITTLRKERRYEDFRHPAEVIFVKDLKTDHYRRDFTINAMYMDNNLKLIDFESGEEDLKNHVLRMVGNPLERLKEDPLRIIRGIRFLLTYDLKFDEELEKAIYETKKYLEMISKDKIKMELKKFKGVPKERINEVFEKFSIKHLLDVVE